MPPSDRLDLPLVQELGTDLSPEEAFLRLVRHPHAIFLDSALRHPELGRFSFVAADPFDFLVVPADTSDGIGQLTHRMQPFSASTIPGLPPFQGGAAGLLGYELGRSLERIPVARFDEFEAPALAVGLYDLVLAFDHNQSRSWVFSHGFPEQEPSRRRRRAAERIQELHRCLAAPTHDPIRDAWTCRSRRSAVESANLAPQFSTESTSRLTSNFSQADYRHAVQRAVDYIRSGDVFQVNLSQRLLHPAVSHPVSLYLRLRRRNPATFAAYFDTGDFQILSASPERFLSVRDRTVETRPIKGTRQRTNWPEADLFAAGELLQSEKDLAENVMIVDLLRNDLSRVCRSDTVRVSQLCQLEVYEFVQHLVSAVRGELEEGKTAADLIRATFPGGSISGAPKIRAMEIISEIEPTARGPYCGCLGYWGFDGSMDLNILIRTITAGRGWWQMPVGGGIVAQSHPQREYEETWHKATGLVRALREDSTT